VPRPSRPSRREFVEASLLGGAALALGGCVSSASSSAGAAPAASRKRILILGGTNFLGPKIVEAALSRGHSVSVFNRGRTEKRIPFEFVGIERLRGNRDPDLPADDSRGADGALLHPDSRPRGLEQLSGREWDAVIDDSGYYPRMVKASAELLAPRCRHYLFISSISAYADNLRVGADEDHALAKLADPSVETMGEGFAHYGGLKALCEQAALAAFPGRAAVVRPGYIVGPGDPTDRFSYWPLRIDRGGEVLAPGSPDDPLQWIDVRDLARWLVKMVEVGTCGAFNAVGPAQPARWGDVLAACVKHARRPATLTWVDADFLESAGAGGAEGGRVNWPIWVAPRGDSVGFHRWSNARAQGAGLRFRPIDDTVTGILQWFPTEIDRRRRVTRQLQEEAVAKGEPPPPMADPEKLRVGPTPEQEAGLLSAWRAAKA